MKKKFKFIYIILFIYILFILYYLSPLFTSNSVAAGWDTIAHISVLQKYPSELIKGNFIFNDPLWFNGFVAYQYYPPLFFILVALANIISFNLLSVILLFKIFIIILIFLFIFALYLFFNKFFKIKSEISIILSMLASFLWLFSPVYFDFYGIGLSSILYLGEFTNFLGIIIGLFLITFADHFFKTKNKQFKDYLIFVFLLSALLLSHVFVFLFFGFLIFVLFFKESLINFNIFKKNLISGLAVVVSTIILCFFWIFPFLRYFNYSSSVAVTNYYTLGNILNLLINNNIYFIIFPFLFILGIFYIFKKKKHYLFYYFLLFFLISVSVFKIPLDIHQYRFFAYTYLLYVIFIVLGLYKLYLLSQTIKLKKYYSKLNLKTFLYILSFIILIYIVVLTLIFIVNGNCGLRNKYLFTLNRYNHDDSSQNLVSFLKSSNPKMVLAEQQIGFENCYSSPHYWEYLFAEHNINSLLGLYTESSTTSLVFPFLNTFSDNSRWLVKGYTSRYVFNDFNTFLDRLKLYNVNFIIASSNKFKYYLNNSIDSNLVKQYKFCDTKYNLYHITNNYSQISPVYSKPILYYSKSDKLWINFSEMWFESNFTYKYPLVRIKNIHNLANFDLNDISGVIVYKINKKDYELIKTSGLPIYFQNSGDSINLKSDQQYKTYKDIFIKNNLNYSISDININSNQINFNVVYNRKVPVLIKKSYSPFWNAYDNTGKINIYEYSPNFMLVYTRGKTKLVFKLPFIYKLLFILYLLFVIFVIFYFLIKKRGR